jgi:hypothetical protein
MNNPKIDLPAEIIDFITESGHAIRGEIGTYLSNNCFWYHYDKNTNLWEIVAPQDLPKPIRDNYKQYLLEIITDIEDVELQEVLQVAENKGA